MEKECEICQGRMITCDCCGNDFCEDCEPDCPECGMDKP